jgi:hypothetical protein
MTRQEHDREDLLAEAAALVERVSLQWLPNQQPSLIGFRRDGGASFYLTPDRVYQFTSGGRLRRAFVDDLLFKAERGELVSLRRQRQSDVVALVRHELDAEARGKFLEAMRQHLMALRDAIHGGRYSIIGQAPAESDVIGLVRDWFERFGVPVDIADSPRSR